MGLFLSTSGHILRNNKAFGRRPVSDVTAQLPQPVPGVFVCWILLAPLVPTGDKTTGADGSCSSGVTAGEAERCSSFNIGVASSCSASLPLLTLTSGAGSTPPFKTRAFATWRVTEAAAPRSRDRPIDRRHETGL